MKTSKIGPLENFLLYSKLKTFDDGGMALAIRVLLWIVGHVMVALDFSVGGLK